MSEEKTPCRKRRRDESKDEEKKKKDGGNPPEAKKKKFEMDPLEPGPVDIQIEKKSKKKHNVIKKRRLVKMQRPGAGAEAHVELCAGKEISLGTAGLLEMIDNIDRPGNSFAVGTYSGAGTFAEGLTDKPGQRLPKAGVYAGFGVGHARAEWSVFDAEAKGPNAGVGVGASAATLSARAFATAEVASASATAGPLKATVGLSVDTGVGVGLTGVEAKFLGTGFSVGRKMGVSWFGTGFEFSWF